MGCGASAEPPKKKLFAFRVRVLSGLNLYNNGFGVRVPGTVTSAGRFQGKSDPYCQIQCGSMILRTRTIPETQNPVWNEELYFESDTRNPVLDIVVKDAEMINDEKIGTYKLDLTGLIPRDKEREMWIPLHGAKANGEIGLGVIECYRTQINLVKGVDLKPMDCFSGTSDAYVEVSVGQQVGQKTDVKGWTNNPVWNHKTKFFVPYGIKSQCAMIIYDHETIGVNKNMGWHYVEFDGTPKPPPQGEAPAIEGDVQGAKGKIVYQIIDDTTVEVPEAKAPTPEQIAKFPQERPGTVSFECRVLGAYNLAAADGVGDTDAFINKQKQLEYKSYRTVEGTSDPFCRIVCEGQIYDTDHKNNTLEPIWNERFRFVARNRYESKLLFQVWDKDLLSDDCIGHVEFPLDQIKPGTKQEIWSLLDKGRGELGVELNQDHQVKVRIISCSDLPAKDMNGMCDPYIKIACGSQLYQSRVVRNNRNPWYEEDFRFFLPTLKGVTLKMGVWDSDLMLPFFNSGMSEDHIGDAEVDMESLIPGQINQFELQLSDASRKNFVGKIKLEIVNEIPLTPSALEELKAKGTEAMNAAIASVNDKIDFIRTIAEPNFEKQQEAVVEVAEPKFAPRPRFSRFHVEVVALRDVPDDCLRGGDVYLGIQLPVQGKRYKTKTYNPSSNVDFQKGEVFDFGVPSREHNVLELFLFENNKHQYAAVWPESHSARASFGFADLNGGAGPIRGSPVNDFWVTFDNGTRACLRVRETFRFQIKVIGARGIKMNADPYIQIRYNNKVGNTSAVSNDPKKDRTEGVAGAPIWNEHFTFFSDDKAEKVEFRLMDKDMTGDEKLGTITYDLSRNRRGVPEERTIKFDGCEGELDIWIMEEEKMGLLDQIVDKASNAAKLVVGAASEAFSGAADAAKGALGALGGALGFGN